MPTISHVCCLSLLLPSLCPSLLARSLVNGFTLQSLRQGHRELTVPLDGLMSTQMGNIQGNKDTKRSLVSSLIEIPYMYSVIFLKFYLLGKSWEDLKRLGGNREDALPSLGIKSSFPLENATTPS